MEIFVPTYKDIKACLLFFPVFFLFVYMDSIILPVSPDLFWKLPAIIGLFIIMLRKGVHKFPKFFVFGVAFGVKQLLFITPNINYYIPAASTAALDLVLPLLTFYFLKFLSYKKIGRYIFIFSSWLILATIPYHLGLLEQSTKGIEEGYYSLEKYGAVGRSFTGPYLSVHGAAITLCIALVGILYNYQKAKQSITKWWIIILASLALITIYQTYVRTALVMLAVGLVIQLFYNQKNTARLFVSAVIFLAVAFGFYIIYLNSEILQLRFANTNIYGSEVAAGSGRLDFWRIMLHYCINNDLFSFLIGTGREAGKDYMYQQIGQRLFSHNGYIDILVSTGLLGLIIYLVFQRALFKRLWKKSNRQLPSYKMVLIIFFMYFIAIIFQAHEFFWVFILMSLIITQIEKEYAYVRVQKRAEMIEPLLSNEVLKAAFS